METTNLSKSASSQGDRNAAGLHLIKGQSEAYRFSKEKPQNGISNSGLHLAVSPVSPLMAPGGKAQTAAKELLDSILDTIVKIFGEQFNGLPHLNISFFYSENSKLSYCCFYRKSCCYWRAFGIEGFTT